MVDRKGKRIMIEEVGYFNLGFLITGILKLPIYTVVNK